MKKAFLLFLGVLYLMVSGCMSSTLYDQYREKAMKDFDRRMAPIRAQHAKEMAEWERKNEEDRYNAMLAHGPSHYVFSGPDNDKYSIDIPYGYSVFPPEQKNDNVLLIYTDGRTSPIGVHGLSIFIYPPDKTIKNVNDLLKNIHDSCRVDPINLFMISKMHAVAIYKSFNVTERWELIVLNNGIFMIIKTKLPETTEITAMRQSLSVMKNGNEQKLCSDVLTGDGKDVGVDKTKSNEKKLSLEFAKTKQHVIAYRNDKYTIDVPENYTAQQPKDTGSGVIYTFNDLTSKPGSVFDIVFMDISFPSSMFTDAKEMEMIKDLIASTHSGKTIKIEKIGNRHYTILTQTPLELIGTDWISKNDYSIEISWDPDNDVQMRAVINSLKQIQ